MLSTLIFSASNQATASWAMMIPRTTQTMRHEVHMRNDRLLQKANLQNVPKEGFDWLSLFD